VVNERKRRLEHIKRILKQNQNQKRKRKRLKVQSKSNQQNLKLNRV
jgi:hypothetical protein